MNKKLLLLFLILLLPLISLRVFLRIMKDAEVAQQKQDKTAQIASLYPPLPKPKSGDWLESHNERGQTVTEFTYSNPNIPSKEKSTIYIQLIEEVDSILQNQIKEFTEAYFTLPVKLLPPSQIDTTQFTSRIHGEKQYLAPEILLQLTKQIPPDAYAIIALTTTDLYPDSDWNFVFGLASFKERVGVFSLNRYKSNNATLFLKRTCKIVNHELGHQFGIKHCISYHCTMNGANHLQEMDSQPMHLCPECLQKMEWSVGFDSRERYQRLKEVYEKFDFVNEFNWVNRWLQINS